MQERKYIAIFDSGIGGFTALQTAVTLFPAEKFLFYADTQNVPYGVKSAAQVKELALKAAADIVTYGVKALVLACNTATSAAAASLRERYQFPILGMEPAIKPALAATQALSANNRVLLLCTPLTMQGGKLAENISKIDLEHRVDCRPLPGLVAFAEKMEFSGSRVTDYLLANVVEPAREDYGAVVLGCTHYIWYKELLRELLPARISLFDGNVGTLNHLRSILADRHAEQAAPGPKREILLHFTGDIGNEKLAALISRIQEPVKII